MTGLLEASVGRCPRCSLKYTPGRGDNYSMPDLAHDTRRNSARDLWPWECVRFLRGPVSGAGQALRDSSLLRLGWNEPGRRRGPDVVPVKGVLDVTGAARSRFDRAPQPIRSPLSRNHVPANSKRIFVSGCSQLRQGGFSRTRECINRVNMTGSQPSASPAHFLVAFRMVRAKNRRAANSAVSELFHRRYTKGVPEVHAKYMAAACSPRAVSMPAPQPVTPASQPTRPSPVSGG